MKYILRYDFKPECSEVCQLFIEKYKLKKERE